MKKIIKLVVLLIICSAIFFIYQKTKNNNYNILNIGDELSISINSYGIKEFSPAHYLKNELTKTYKKVRTNNKYSTYENSIKIMLEQLKYNNEIKKELSNTNIILLTLGYNDLIYKLNVSDELSESKFIKIMNAIEVDYNNLIKELRKYSKRKILVIGYPDTNKDEYYLKKGIRRLNEILENNKNIIFINSYEILNDRNKYFSNPYSYYPNRYGYLEISKEIIRKTLEK